MMYNHTHSLPGKISTVFLCSMASVALMTHSSAVSTHPITIAYGSRNKVFSLWDKQAGLQDYFLCFCLISAHVHAQE